MYYVLGVYDEPMPPGMFGNTNYIDIHRSFCEHWIQNDLNNTSSVGWCLNKPVRIVDNAFFYCFDVDQDYDFLSYDHLEICINVLVLLSALGAVVWGLRLV